MSDYKAKDAEAGTQTYVQPIAGSGEATPPNEKVMQGEDEFGTYFFSPLTLLYRADH